MFKSDIFFSDGNISIYRGLIFNNILNKALKRHRTCWFMVYGV